MMAEEKEPFEKIARDKSVRQALMAECVTDALQKKKGEIVCVPFAAWPTRRIIGAVTKRFQTGSRGNPLMRYTAKMYVPASQRRTESNRWNLEGM
jgi:hypothetical protein